MITSGISLQFLIFLFFGLGGSLGAPFGLPPGPEDPVMSAIAPDECLAYSTWSGSVTPRADGPVTERWLAQPEMLESWQKIQTAYIDYCVSMADTEDESAIRSAARLAQHLMTNSAAWYASEVVIGDWGPEKMIGGAVVDLGDDASQLYDDINELVSHMIADSDLTVESTTIDDRPFQILRIELPDEGRLAFTWGMIDDRHFAATSGEGEMKRLLDRAATPPPQWLTELRQRLPVQRVSSVSHVDGSRLMKLVVTSIQMTGAGPEVDEVMRRIGLDGFRGFNIVTGLDDDGFIGRGEILIEGEPVGLLGMFSDTPLQPEMLGSIADDRMLVTAAALSPSKIFQMVRNLAEINEHGEREFRETIDGLNQAAELDFEHDIINQLDEHAYVYGSINLTNPSAGWVLSGGASSEMALTDPYENIMKMITTNLEKIDEFELTESDVNGNAVFTLDDQREWAFMPDISWSLANGEMLFSFDKSSIRRHLRRESMASDAMVKNQWFARLFEPPHDDATGPVMVSSVDYAQMIKIGLPILSPFADQMFPDDLDFSFDDLPSVDVLTRDMRPSMTSVFRTSRGLEFVQRQTYPGGSPVNLIAGTATITLPAITAARRAAMRTDSANRMRQMVLAMHNYHDANGALPARFAMDAEGNPLLSWRVHILPYIEQNDLYQQFHLDEPWDSEHNKTLVDQMPSDYSHPSLKLESGHTVYMAPQGPGAIMIDPESSVEERGNPVGTRFEDVRDGTSQTALLLETSAENAVIWSKPDDYKWEDQMRPENGLCDAWKSGVNVALADGSVQFFTFEKLADIFEALVKSSDGEVIDLWND